MPPFSVFDVTTIAHLKVSEEGTISIRQHSSQEYFHIHPEDELYEYHLRSCNALKQQTIDAWANSDAEASDS